MISESHDESYSDRRHAAPYARFSLDPHPLFRDRPRSGAAPLPPTEMTLQEVTVTAARGTALERLDISTTVLTREDLQQMPEEPVDQILNHVPGVFTPDQPTYQLHPTGQELNIRGFGSSTNELLLVLVEGVPINDPYLRTVNWTQIPKRPLDA
ncbi:MAG: Plug domain-containing protein [Alphaproteobacteria bacterium]|nr:Plug domain-containing protein [Alphaproteobacteria bacterium]